MPLAASAMPAGQNLIAALDEAVAATEALFADARRAVAARVTVEGRPMARVFDREQRATHGLAWLATYVEAIRQLAAYAGTDDRHRQFRRDRGLGRAHRRRRISGANSRRHSHEPGRDRPPGRSGLERQRGGGADHARRRSPHRHRQHRGASCAARRIDARAARRHRRHLRPRRYAGFDPRGDAQIRRRPGRAATRRRGISTTNTFRSMSSRRCPSSACSA